MAATLTTAPCTHSLARHSAVFAKRRVDFCQTFRGLAPSAQCNGAATKVACTNLKSVTVNCSCLGCGSVWAPQVTMFVNVDMYIYNGPIVPGMAKDTTIKNFGTAIDHEINKHLAPAANNLEKWLKSWVTDMPSQLDCENECKQIENLSPNYFKGALSKTKTND